MAVWFIRLQLDRSAAEEQATALAVNFGHVYVDSTRNRTEVIMYAAYTNIINAMNESVNALNTYVRRISFYTKVVQVEVMSKEDRLVELAAQGLTEESIKE